MSDPSGIAVDASGNIYISDYIDCRIRKVTTAGIISTIAGIGINGSTGDGGPAASAELNQPMDVLVDGSGNIFVVSLYGGIRKILPNGTITTISDSGSLLFPDQFALQANGYLVIADTADFQVKQLTTSGTLQVLAGNDGYRNSPNGTPAQIAWLESPQDVALDAAGNLTSPTNIWTTAASAK